MGPVGRFEGRSQGPGSRPGSTRTTAARRGPNCSLATGAAGPHTRACAASAEVNALPGTLSKRWERKNLGSRAGDSDVQRGRRVPLSLTPASQHLQWGWRLGVSSPPRPDARLPRTRVLCRGSAGTHKEESGGRAGALGPVCSSSTPFCP